MILKKIIANSEKLKNDDSEFKDNSPRVISENISPELNKVKNSQSSNKKILNDKEFSVKIFYKLDYL